MIRHRKGPGVVARKRIPSRRKPHYVMAYLWESVEAMAAGACAEGTTFLALPEDVERDGTGRALGYCNTNWYAVDVPEGGGESTISSPPLLAEVHFACNEWTEEIVAHELTHALMHRLMVPSPSFDDVRDGRGAGEEEVCKDFGLWVEAVWRWLWEVNPYGRHAEGRVEAPPSAK